MKISGAGLDWYKKTKDSIMGKNPKKTVTISNAQLVSDLMALAGPDEIWEAVVTVEVPFNGGGTAVQTFSTGAAALVIMEKYVLQLAQYMETADCCPGATIPTQPPELLTLCWQNFVEYSQKPGLPASTRVLMNRAKKRMAELGMRAASMLEQLGENY